MVAVPSIKLSSGHDMPQVGFGLWKVDNAVAADTVYEAIKAGYRLFDGAADYGNEVECGQGIARAIAEGLVKREELFIVSKLWNTFHDGERVEPIVRKQLADWGIDYFDLYLIHFPVALEYVDPSVRYPPGWHYEGDEIRPSKATIQETWTAMEGLVGAGLAKSIGISNFQAQLVYDLLRYAKIRPATLQIEHHPYLVQQELLNLAKREGIAVTAYSSFGPASFLEFNMQHAVKLTPLIEDDTIKSIAAKYNRDPSQVLLRWATQRGLAIIPKSTRPALIASNLASIEFDLSEEDIAKISAFDRGIRFNQPSNYFPTELLWIFG
ncbi:NADP-dependent oxidoreductase domain-containing protein [Immersiella caudata]|uniref:NADP-dependent oxidoreductase domain-containing protein n=1 Tax=Immersiella caudata TaxID=314043 RepID=A0AA39XDM0_9PEZI|nr:NADP-dependent oxidoreductase domain-containing protein [Immersiella caudata]